MNSVQHKIILQFAQMNKVLGRSVYPAYIFPFPEKRKRLLQFNGA